MKSLFFVLVIFLSFFTAKGQCPLVDADLMTQADINSFPGSCTNLSGSILIHDIGIDPIVDLTPLANLVSVGGSFSIETNPVLSSLGGLDSLRTIGGDLNIDDNPALLNIFGLDSLNSVGGALNISDNPLISSLENLASLTNIGGSLNISSTGLLSLIGLDSINFVGGDLNINSTQIFSLSGLNNLTSVPFGTISIGSNDNLVSVGGWLDSLTSVGGNVMIQNNPALQSIIGLDSLTSIGGIFVVQSNPVLASFAGFSSLANVGGGILATNNSSLADCCIFFPYLNNGGTGTFSNNLDGCNSIDQVISNCGPILHAPVPTMGEWGMIFLVLITLNLGILFMKYPRLKLVGVEGLTGSGPTFRNTPFDSKSYGKILVITFTLVLLGFVFAIYALGYSLTNADIPGALICIPFFSFLVYQIILKE